MLNYQTLMAPDMPSPDSLARIADALRGIRFGAVEIQIHDGEIVQIERRERIRPTTVAGRRHQTTRQADRTTGGGTDFGGIP